MHKKNQFKKYLIVFLLIATFMSIAYLTAEFNNEDNIISTPDTFIHEGIVTTLKSGKGKYFMLTENFNENGTYKHPAREKELTYNEYSLIRKNKDYDILVIDDVKPIDGKYIEIKEYFDVNGKGFLINSIGEVLDGSFKEIEFDKHQEKRVILIQDGDVYYKKTEFKNRDGEYIKDAIYELLSLNEYEKELSNGNYDYQKLTLYDLTNESEVIKQTLFIDRNNDFILRPRVVMSTGFNSLDEYMASIKKDSDVSENNSDKDNTDEEDDEDNDDNWWIFGENNGNENENPWDNEDDNIFDWDDLWNNVDDTNEGLIGGGSKIDIETPKSNNSSDKNDTLINKGESKDNEDKNSEETEEEKIGYFDNKGVFIETDVHGNVLPSEPGKFDNEGNFYPEGENYYYDPEGIRHPITDIKTIGTFDRLNERFYPVGKNEYFDKNGLYHPVDKSVKGGYYDKNNLFFSDNEKEYFDENGYLHDVVTYQNGQFNEEGKFYVGDTSSYLTKDQFGRIKVIGQDGFYDNNGLFHSPNGKIGYFNANGKFQESEENKFSELKGFFDSKGYWYSYDLYYIDNNKENRLVMKPELGLTIEDNKIKAPNLKGYFSEDGLYHEEDKVGYFNRFGVLISSQVNPYEGGFYTDSEWVSNSFINYKTENGVRIAEINDAYYDNFGIYHTPEGDLGRYNEEGKFLAGDINIESDFFYDNKGNKHEFGRSYKDKDGNIFITGDSKFYTSKGHLVNAKRSYGEVDKFGGEINKDGRVIIDNKVGHYNEKSEFVAGLPLYNNGYYDANGNYIYKNGLVDKDGSIGFYDKLGEFNPLYSNGEDIIFNNYHTESQSMILDNYILLANSKDNITPEELRVLEDKKVINKDIFASLLIDKQDNKLNKVDELLKEGLKESKEELNIYTREYESINKTGVDININEALRNNSNLFISTSQDILNSIIENEEILSQKDINIVAIDTFYDNDLVNNISVDMSDVSFLAGYIAAKTTETGNIGVIIGGEDANSIKNSNAFKAGAYYLEEKDDKKITIIEESTLSYTDKSKATEVAEDLYSNKEVDVIYPILTGEAERGVINKATELNKWIIGYKFDNSYLSKNNFITVAEVNFNNLIKEVVALAKMSQLNSNNRFGLKDDVVGIKLENSNLSDKTKEEIVELKSLLTSETIIIPSTDTELKEFKDNIFVYSKEDLESIDTLLEENNDLETVYNQNDKEIINSRNEELKDIHIKYSEVITDNGFKFDVTIDSNNNIEMPNGLIINEDGVIGFYDDKGQMIALHSMDKDKNIIKNDNEETSTKYTLTTKGVVVREDDSIGRFTVNGSFEEEMPLGNGFFDFNNNYHVYGEEGYFDSNGNLYRPDGSVSYFDKNGKRHLGTNPYTNGFYDSFKNWIGEGEPLIRYYSEDGIIEEATELPYKTGFYDSYKNWHPFEQGEGFIKTEEALSIEENSLILDNGIAILKDKTVLYPNGVESKAIQNEEFLELPKQLLVDVKNGEYGYFNEDTQALEVEGKVITLGDDGKRLSDGTVVLLDGTTIYPGSAEVVKSKMDENKTITLKDNRMIRQDGTVGEKEKYKGFYDPNGTIIKTGENSIGFFNKAGHFYMHDNEGEYYDYDGTIILYGEVVGHYDSDGKLHEDVNPYMDGFYDKDSNWHPFGDNGYFDSNGDYHKSVSDQTLGYYNKDGVFIEGTNPYIGGHYDHNGYWRPSGLEGYFDGNGTYHYQISVDKQKLETENNIKELEDKLSLLLEEIDKEKENIKNSEIKIEDGKVEEFEISDELKELYANKELLENKLEDSKKKLSDLKPEDKIGHYEKDGSFIEGEENPYLDGYYDNNNIFTNFVDGRSYIYFNKFGEKKAGVSPYDDGFYDNNGFWHPFNEEGYFDNNGTFITYDLEQRYYDKQGNFLYGTNPYTNGFYDSKRNWHPFEGNGYYSIDGTFNKPDGTIGYFMKNGEFIAGERNINSEGFFDEFGSYIAFNEDGYYKSDNTFVKNIIFEERYQYGSDNYILNRGYFANGIPNVLRRGSKTLQYSIDKNTINPRYIETGLLIPENSIVEYENLIDAIHGIGVHTNSRFIKDNDFSMLLYKGRIVNLERNKGITVQSLRNMFIDTKLDIGIRPTRFGEEFRLVEAVETNQDLKLFVGKKQHKFVLPLISRNDEVYISAKDVATIAGYKLELTNEFGSSNIVLRNNEETKDDNSINTISLSTEDNELMVNGELQKSNDKAINENINGTVEAYIPLKLLPIAMEEEMFYDATDYKLFFSE